MFAVEAFLDIAYNGGRNPVQSAEITRRQGIPRRYLEQVLQQLVRDGLLTGVRGPRGGYRLARERRRITLGEIVRSVRAMESSDDPLEDASGSTLGHEVCRPLWRELSDGVMEQLDGLTIDDLCRRARHQGLSSEQDEQIDYII